MADDTNIKQFNATDIVKYHQGLLSSKERHDLEKAALDDPFLADALEGYNTAGVNVSTDINELKSRLNERTSAGKVVSIPTNSRSVFAWWKVAAMIILIGGSGFLVYRFAFFNNKQQEVAKLQNENIINPLIKNDSLVNTPAGTTTENISSNAVQEKEVINSRATLNQNGSGKTSIDEKYYENKMYMATDTLSITEFKKTAGVPYSTAPPTPVTEKSGNADISTSDSRMLNNNNKTVTDKKAIADDSYKQKAVVANQNKEEALSGKTSGLVVNNNFRGRVMDAENNPLPFASITNEGEKAGTYSDANGYFTLTSPDSVMNVQIRSVGFENNNVALRSNVNNNQVVLQENRNNLSEVVVTGYNTNSNRSLEMRKSNIKIEEPEPVDGWSKYDTYIANNLYLPVKKGDKQIDGIVELSFDINKKGRPENIKIEKSLCKPCDEEAIRLVKEGPRWKKSKKNIRARVAIPFKE